MTFEIVGDAYWLEEPEVLDTADSEAEADELVDEYLMAFGSDWSISWRVSS